MTLGHFKCDIRLGHINMRVEQGNEESLVLESREKETNLWILIQGSPYFPILLSY